MKKLFMKRMDLELVINAYLKTQDITREAAEREFSELLKTAEPDADLIILEEFSSRNIEYRK